MLLISQYLAQSRVRTLGDLSAGLFLCTLASQYEVLSKRLVPEAMNFLLNAFLILVPTAINAKAIPGSFPSPDFAQEHVKSLRLRSTKKLSPQKLNLATSLSAESSNTQIKVDLSSAAIALLQDFAEKYVSLDAFVEVFKPVEAIVSSTALDLIASSLQVSPRLSLIVDGAPPDSFVRRRKQRIF